MMAVAETKVNVLRARLVYMQSISRLGFSFLIVSSGFEHRTNHL